MIPGILESEITPSPAVTCLLRGLSTDLADKGTKLKSKKRKNHLIVSPK